MADKYLPNHYIPTKSRIYNSAHDSLDIFAAFEYNEYVKVQQQINYIWAGVVRSSHVMY